MLKQIRPFVFWPSLILLSLALFYSLLDKEAFLNSISTLYFGILKYTSWLFALMSFSMFLMCIIILISPLGKIKIGGKDAKPVLSNWRWFSIILCTTIATGILFWGTAEPLYHFTSPPKSLEIIPKSKEAARFAMSTMYLHWSFIPYAIYAIPAMLFAVSFYNRNTDYTISSTLFPLMGNTNSKAVNSAIDSIALFALIAGMAASLGGGLLTLSGGLDHLFNIEKSFLQLSLICAAIVGVYLISAISGVLKGIRILSIWNLRMFILIMILFLFFTPMNEILILNFEGLFEFFSKFHQKISFTGDLNGDDWPKKWTIFNWANWMAWAPVTALFLGSLAYGRTIREFFLFTWILPSFFGIIWMSILAGSAIQMEFNGTLELSQVLNQNGPEAVVYALLEIFPYSKWISALFILAVFLSFVTAADSTTIAMGALCSKNIDKQNPDPPKRIKIIWGLIVGVLSLVMVTYAGIDGIKMISNIGGLPIVLLYILFLGSAIRIFRKNRVPDN